MAIFGHFIPLNFVWDWPIPPNFDASYFLYKQRFCHSLKVETPRQVGLWYKPNLFFWSPDPPPLALNIVGMKEVPLILIIWVINSWFNLIVQIPCLMLSKRGRCDSLQARQPNQYIKTEAVMFERTKLTYLFYF